LYDAYFDLLDISGITLLVHFPLKMGTLDLDHIGRIIKHANYHEWKEEKTALLSGFSRGHYLTQEIDYNEDNESTIKEGNRCHYLLYSTQPTPRCGIQGGSTLDTLAAEIWS
jgi:hypothetical protein